MYFYYEVRLPAPCFTTQPNSKHDLIVFAIIRMADAAAYQADQQRFAKLHEPLVYTSGLDSRRTNIRKRLQPFRLPTAVHLKAPLASLRAPI